MEWLCGVECVGLVVWCGEVWCGEVCRGVEWLCGMVWCAID